MFLLWIIQWISLIVKISEYTYTNMYGDVQ